MAGTEAEKTQSQIYVEKLEESYKQNRKLNGQNEALRTQNTALAKQNETLNTQNSTLAQQIETLNAQNSDLLGQNTALGSRIYSLKDVNGQLVEELATIKSRKKPKAGIILIVFLVLLTGGLVFCCYRMFSYKDQYEYARSRHMQAQALLQQVQTTLSEKETELKQAQETLSEKETELKRAQAALSEKETELKQVQSTLSERDSGLQQAQQALSEAEEKWGRFHSELAKLSGMKFGRVSETFYAEQDIVVLHVGETKTVKVHTDTVLASFSRSDVEAITIKTKKDASDTGEVAVDITAKASGICTVNCTQVYGSKIKIPRSFHILVVVLDK